MSKQTLMVLLIVAMMHVTDAGAKEVSLDIGETYSQGDLTVTCSQSSTVDSPLTINDCQYWDDFNKKCLFEKKTYTYQNLECVEECQHWEKFNSTCHYQTKCMFYPSQRSFVQTTCGQFDAFNKTCLRTKELKIGR